MNRCDTCQHAEFEFSEIKLKDECVDCTLGYRHKFESDEDCKKYKELKGESNHDCRNCDKWKTCGNGEKGHANGTSIGYSIGECRDYAELKREQE